MRRLKSIISLSVCAALLFSMTACWKSNDKSTASPSEGTAQLEHMDISWLAAFCAGLSPDNWSQKELEKKFNVTFKIPDVDTSDKQKFDLMVASGEMPDFTAGLMKTPIELYEQEVTRSIPTSIIRKSAPNYAKLLDNNPAGWKMNVAKDKKDELTAMTGFVESQSSYPYYSSFYRLDWLENLGIKPKGTLEQIDAEGKLWIASEAFTRDEFLNILDKFTNGDPDKNGKNDTIGTIGMKDLNHTWFPLMGSYGLNEAYSINENGKAIFYYSSEKYKDFLKTVADVYKKGLIDREYLTNDFQKMSEKYAKGNAGYAATVTIYMSSEANMLTRAPMNMLKADPKAKIVMTPPEVGPNKEQGVPIYSATPFRYNFYISKKVDDKKLERILQIFDYAAVSKEGFQKFRFGEEGKHYTVQEKNGFKFWKWNDGVNFGKDTGFGVFNTNMVVPNDGRMMSETPEVQKLTKNYLLTDKWLKYNIYPYKFDLTGSTKFAEVQAQTKATLDTIIKEFYSKSVTGEINSDKEWDAYIQKLNKAGYDKLLEEINKAPLYKDVISGK